MTLTDHNILWTSTEAAVVTGGRNTGEWAATGIALNMDDLQAGDLFVASREDDLNKVFDRGAAAVMVTAGCAVPASLPALMVGDVFDALQNLARAARFRTHANIVSVQGKEARAVMENILTRSASVHAGGRHLSLGLAGLPADVEYGVFGASPAVRPDIAVITNSTTANRDTLFENISSFSTVIINADDEDFLSVVARARAANIQHIFTYGQHASSDARVCEHIEAANGIRLSVNVLGADYTFTMMQDFSFTPEMLAAMLVLKLTDKSLSASMRPFSSTLEQGRVIADNSVSLIAPSQGGVHHGQQAVFRITNMIDLGYGRQTAVLDNVVQAGSHAITLCKKGLSMPDKLASLNFVYTGKGVGAVSNARAVIGEKCRGARIEPIIPEVAAPGDFLVFKDIWSNSKSKVSEALRAVPHNGGVRKMRRMA